MPNLNFAELIQKQYSGFEEMKQVITQYRGAFGVCWPNSNWQGFRGKNNRRSAGYSN